MDTNMDIDNDMDIDIDTCMVFRDPCSKRPGAPCAEASAGQGGQGCESRAQDGGELSPEGPREFARARGPGCGTQPRPSHYLQTDLKYHQTRVSHWGPNSKSLKWDASNRSEHLASTWHAFYMSTSAAVC